MVSMNGGQRQAGRHPAQPDISLLVGSRDISQSVSQSVSAWTVMRCGVGLTDVRTPERREIDSFRRRLR